MKKLTGLVLFLLLAVSIVAPASIHINNHADHSRQVASGGAQPNPPWPPC
jgi:hypothetical protein